jgi:hypothetical protein
MSEHSSNSRQKEAMEVRIPNIKLALSVPYILVLERYIIKRN